MNGYAVSTEGLFNNLTFGDAEKLLSFSPAGTVIRDNELEKVFHYRWLSLLRPVMGQPQPELFLVSSATEPAYAIAYYTDPEDAKSGFFGDSIPLMMPEDYERRSPDNPLGLPDAPLNFPGLATPNGAVITPEPAKE